MKIFTAGKIQIDLLTKKELEIEIEKLENKIGIYDSNFKSFCFLKKEYKKYFNALNTLYRGGVS